LHLHTCVYIICTLIVLLLPPPPPTGANTPHTLQAESVPTSCSLIL
jgi:hypothetical protein